ncbi:MAG: response regulator [Candidatus Omnitrophica bacterium]|nr:response regulator [Candidatus Omnitrophota bacterium]MCM8827862.1 response regulator [Candidatus Omnitrophota bacterium]
MNGKTVFIVEDEKDISSLIALHLRKAGFIVLEFANGNDLLNFLKKKIPDLIVLDLMLPDIDGMEICKHIKSEQVYKNIPVIILTAKAEETDKIIGLELGADDYVTKPFSPRELVVRTKNILKRYDFSQEDNIQEIGGILSIDNDRYEVYVKNKKIHLTTTEFNILKILLSKKGLVFSREKLLDLLWQGQKAVIDRTIDVHIKKLREKLGEAGNLIKNVRGIGYKIDE